MLFEGNLNIVFEKSETVVLWKIRTSVGWKAGEGGPRQGFCSKANDLDLTHLIISQRFNLKYLTVRSNSDY